MTNEELLKVIEEAGNRGLLINLTTLYLYENQLSTLPSELFQLANLTWLDLRRNLFTTLPPEIDRQGSDAIRQYFIEREKDKRLLNEVKILFIGEGSAGKTSLVKQLLDQPFDQHEDTTHGISIQGWEPQCGGKAAL